MRPQWRAPAGGAELGECVCAHGLPERKDAHLAGKLSPRLATLVNALPLEPGVRVLEIGCGRGAAARAIADRIGDGHVLAIDRSAVAVEQARATSRVYIESGRLSVRQCAVEYLALEPGEALYDLAVAFRVGSLDGRLNDPGRGPVPECLVPGHGDPTTYPGASPSEVERAVTRPIEDALASLKTERRAREHIAGCLVPSGRLFIEGGNPLREVPLPSDR